MPDDPFSLRLYRRLLKLYPVGFRENYAQALEREFRDELNESPGAVARTMLWLRLLADLAISVPSQLSREIYAVSVLFIASTAAIAIWIATRPSTQLDIVEILRSE